MVDFSFLKKLIPPKLSGFSGRLHEVVGIDIGTHSTKVIQLRYEKERAILQTYGEFLNQNYLKKVDSSSANFLRYLDSDIAALLKDTLTESRVTVKDAVIAVPATSSFIVTISLPQISRNEAKQAIPYEARKYIPIPISEVVLSWEILEEETKNDMIEALLIAVPREVVNKLKRIAELADITLHGLEIETFSVARSLVRRDPTPTGIINLGSQSTTLAIVDQGKFRTSRNFSKGSHELTLALARGLDIGEERAEAIKRDAGLSEKIEEREMTSIMAPLIEILFTDIERFIAAYNRKSTHKIQKIILTGGGSNLKGIIEVAASRFGVEIVRENPFSRLVTPPFMQPILQEIGPSFPVAIGLALRDAG